MFVFLCRLVYPAVLQSRPAATWCTRHAIKPSSRTSPSTTDLRKCWVFRYYRKGLFKKYINRPDVTLRHRVEKHLCKAMLISANILLNLCDGVHLIGCWELVSCFLNGPAPAIQVNFRILQSIKIIVTNLLKSYSVFKAIITLKLICIVFGKFTQMILESI